MKEKKLSKDQYTRIRELLSFVIYAKTFPKEFEELEMVDVLRHESELVHSLSVLGGSLDEGFRVFKKINDIATQKPGMKNSIDIQIDAFDIGRMK